jgi:microcystin-dependent protein
MDEYLSVVKLFALPQGYIMRGWLPCDGRKMNLNQYTALYSLIGNRFGGNGTSEFNLPKLVSPDPNMTYHICIQGMYPSRE